MKRYLIILIAILAGLIAFAVIDKLSKGEHGGVKPSHIIGAIVAFITLSIGLFLLEIGAAAPETTYVPAKVIDGQVVKPEFQADELDLIVPKPE